MPIKVLIVLDGSYRFADDQGSTPDFTYTELVNTLAGEGMDVTRAHRREPTVSSPAEPGVLHEFDFADHNLLQYDVIWLFGKDGRNGGPTSTADSLPAIPDEQILAITEFMDAGGGVFATGDHDSIGTSMCGHLPRIRAMRAWFGPNDDISPMPDNFPRNYHQIGTGRADTVQRNPLGNYPANGIYFENQSDKIPQPLTIVPPTHAILRHDDEDIDVFPDHMHEGQTLGEVELDAVNYDYDQNIVGSPNDEFPALEGVVEKPQIIATGQSLGYAQYYGWSESSLDTTIADPKTVNTFSVYDGRKVGIGRIITGATFHHYIDINLTGDTRIDTDEKKDRTGPSAEKGHGFNDDPAVFEKIKAVYINITNWLARPRPRLEVILERSTFSQDEVSGNPNFNGAVLVTVSGLKPNQFPGGGVSGGLSAAQLASRAPVFNDVTGVNIAVNSVDTDDPGYPDRVQRITFTYNVTIDSEDAFGFDGNNIDIPVTGTLISDAVAGPLTDTAWIQLVKSANPFMLDLDHSDAKTWLSSDVRVFPVIAGEGGLPANASRAQALDYIQDYVTGLSTAAFNALPVQQSESALSPLPTTTGADSKKVYNFAVARVRLNGNSASAENVRVFFRIFTSQTTAALTYIHPDGELPQQGYLRTDNASPIALPGTTSGGGEWLSFPFFAQARTSPTSSQADGFNVKDIAPNPGSEVTTFFGALIDNNLDDPYLPIIPSESGSVPLPTLLMGEHQCLVAQIEYDGTPIPSGSRPSTSDKLSQRNLAMSTIANPGLNASRMAMHTFEIEATPRPITANLPADELLLDWDKGVPKGTEVRIFIPSWKAHKVVELADKMYARHEIRVLDDHTIAIPAGGSRYVPIPQHLGRQTGVLSLQFPLGVKKGQRFDLAVQQITNRIRRGKFPPTQTTEISAKEAAKLLAKYDKAETTHAKRKTFAAGVYDLGDNKTLVTDLSIFDAVGDHALLIEHPDPKKVERARQQSGLWREVVGAFQLGIPVSMKDDMLIYHMRLLSAFRWRAEHLRLNSRWYETFMHYLDLLTEKVKALGGDVYKIPPHVGGIIPLPTDPGDDNPDDGSSDGEKPGDDDVPGGDDDPFFEPGDDDWLSETDGLGDPKKVKPAAKSGKVSGLLYDHFGDFEGFTLETYNGSNYRFFSRETAILDIARTAWLDRYVVTVITVSSKSRRVRRLLIRGYSD